jgi:hypothetical protein
VLSFSVINRSTDWSTWSSSPEIDPVIRSLYGSLPDQETEIVDFTKMEQEARLSGNDCGPMVETDEDSWRKCLTVALQLLETRIKETEAAAKAAAEAAVKLAAEAAAKLAAEAAAKLAAEAAAKLATEAAAKAAAEAASSTPMQLDKLVPGSSKRPSVCFSSGYPVFC